MLELRTFVDIKPLEAGGRFIQVLLLPRRPIQRQISPGHVSAALGRILAMNAKQRTQVERALANRLLQNPLHQFIAERQRTSPRRQPIKRFVASIVLSLDPSLQRIDSLLDAIASMSPLTARGSRHRDGWSAHDRL